MATNIRMNKNIRYKNLLKSKAYKFALKKAHDKVSSIIDNKRFAIEYFPNFPSYINLPTLYEEDFSDLTTYTEHTEEFVTIYNSSNNSGFSYIINSYFIHLIFFAFAFIIPVLFNVNLSPEKLILPSSTKEIALNTLSESSQDVPEMIVIPNLAINTTVSRSNYKNGSWAESENSASYDQESASLNTTRGHTLIFAHAKTGLFSNLLNISSKDSIFILGSSNKLYEYNVSGIETVDPSEVYKMESLGDHNLTLITCQGEDDKYRLLVKATLRSDYKVQPEEVI